MKFLIYSLRWQLSSIVLAPCIALIPQNPVVSAVVANLIGGCIFYWIDKWIFRKDQLVKKENQY